MLGPSLSTKAVILVASSAKVDVMVLSSVCVDIGSLFPRGAIGLVDEYCNSP